MRVRFWMPPLVLVMGFAAWFLLAPAPVASQVEDATCLPIVEQILTQTGENCDGLGRNTVCYGYNRLDATFSGEVAEDFFSQPADLADLTNLSTISTAPLSETEDQWGVAVMRAQANIPNTLPGQNVVFILFGDMQLENAVAPEDVFQGAAEPISVFPRSSSNVRSRPTTRSNVVTAVPGGAELLADAVSEDRQWFRVSVSDDESGWINAAIVTAPADAVDTLPVLTGESFTPMQAFYLSSGANDLSCNQAPPLLVVQGPEGITVELTINGVDVRLSSTMAVRLLSPSSMQIIAVSGSLTVDDVRVPVGYKIDAPLTGDGREQDGEVGGVRGLSRTELNELAALELIPANLLNYPINLTPPQPINTPAPAVTQQPGTSSSDPAPAACGGLRATSPLDAWAPRSTTFYWDPAPGATSYRLNIVGLGPIEVTSTNATLDLLGQGGNDLLTRSLEEVANGQIN